LIPPHRASRPERRPAPSPRTLFRENERLLLEVERLRQQLAEKAEQVAEQGKQIADRDLQIEDLKRQLAARQRNSTNSSKPPSSDGLAGNPRPRGRQKGKKSRRRVGGQPGHRGSHRARASAERVDDVRPVLPEQCRHCGYALPQQVEDVVTTGEPHRHQVTEIPPIQARIIEYQCHRVVCPECGKGTLAPVPAEARGQFGPQLTALIVYLTVVCRMPRRVVESLLAQVLGIEISLGSTQKCWEEGSGAVAARCEELQKNLKQEPVLNIDETGWRTNGDKRYLWVFVAAQYVVYTVAATRASEVLVQMLGAVFQGILCSDRFSAYLKYHKGKAQFCWAHLKRTLLGIAEFTKANAVERFCRDALAQHAKLFRLWHKFCDGRIDRSQLLRRSIPIQQQIFEIAGRNLDSPDKEVRNLALALYEYNERLFTFLEAAGVEPTNNTAERALRIAVQMRKIFFGNRSAKGELAIARLLTISQTCSKQGHNVLAYLSAAILSHRRRQPAPSLLPR
jgi:transposase